VRGFLGENMSILETVIIEKMPDGYRELALSYLRPNHAQIKPLTENIEDVLPLAFNWKLTPQGYEWWRQVQKSFFVTKKSSFTNRQGQIVRIPEHKTELPKLWIK